MAATTHFMNGSTKTLAHTILAKLFKGNSYISLLPYTSDGLAWSAANFEGADQLFTLADTFDIPQDAPTSTDIKIDQKAETIDTSVEAGTWNFNGTIPTNCAAVLEVFYSKAKQGITMNGQEGTAYSGEGFFMTPKEVYASVLVEDEQKKNAIAFAKVKMIAQMQRDTDSGLMVVAISGTILANDEATGLEGDFAIGATA